MWQVRKHVQAKYGIDNKESHYMDCAKVVLCNTCTITQVQPLACALGPTSDRAARHCLLVSRVVGSTQLTTTSLWVQDLRELMLRNSRLHYLPLDPTTGMVSSNFAGSSASSQSSLTAPVPPVSSPPPPLSLKRRPCRLVGLSACNALNVAGRQSNEEVGFGRTERRRGDGRR